MLSLPTPNPEASPHATSLQSLTTPAAAAFQSTVFEGALTAFQATVTGTSALQGAATASGTVLCWLQGSPASAHVTSSYAGCRGHWLLAMQREWEAAAQPSPGIFVVGRARHWRCHLETLADAACGTTISLNAQRWR